MYTLRSVHMIIDIEEPVMICNCSACASGKEQEFLLVVRTLRAVGILGTVPGNFRVTG